MKVAKVNINGTPRSGAALDGIDHPQLQLKTSILVSDTVRGGGERNTVEVSDNDVCELVFADNTTWLGSLDTLEQLYPAAVKVNRDGEAVFELPSTLEHPDATRGILGDIALKIFSLFARKVAKKGMKILAAELEDQQMDGFKGLVKITDSWELEHIKPGDISAKNSPVILFIHGTNSSTKGSFSELRGTGLWKYITTTYGDNSVLGFQHETLSKSPLQNAAELVADLPAGVELHIITHSRGGLVGEILSRFSNKDGPDTGFTQREIGRLKKHKRAQDVAYIAQLQKAYTTKRFKVTRFIRVASPAAGTTLLSGRLDHFLNMSLNLLGLVMPAGIAPVYAAMKSLLIAAIDQRHDISVLPGLEAMDPDSPFIAMLNNQDTTISGPVVAISGNSKASLNLKALVIIGSKLFFKKDNDLVVDTVSMYEGSKRTNRLRYFFDEGTDVDHFSYFKNKKTNQAIMDALQAPGPLELSNFATFDRGGGGLERQALLNLDGGAYTSGDPSGKRPIVIILPGIMGSNLSKDNECIWVAYLRMLSGALSKLGIDEDGIEPSSIIKTSYEKLGAALSAEYDVVTFAFDWRRPLRDSALLFEKKVLELLKLKQPIKVVGHSMGGVLVRDFMVFCADTWDELNRSEGFKLLFLGAPLGGSYRIVNVLMGEDDIIKKLSRLDQLHTKKELLQQFVQYPGILSLLPLAKNDNGDLAELPTWKKLAATTGEDDWPIPDKDDLIAFGNYRKEVNAAMTNIDLSRAIYIAGQDEHTPCGYRIDDASNNKPGRLALFSTGEGDQSVTWDTGIPQKMITSGTVYYVSHSHGALSNSPDIFNGILEILQKGSTTLFSTKRPAMRGDQQLFRTPANTDVDMSPDGVLRTLMGISSDERLQPSQLPVQVVVSHGDLRYASYPLLAGHFLNDSILYAEERIDRLLKGLLQERYKLGIYPGDIGTSEVLLTYAKKGFKGAIIAGLGSQDKLTAFQLARTTEQAVSKYLLIVNGRERLNTQVLIEPPIGISSLIIASGYGGLSTESSVHAILQGVVNANARIAKLYSDQVRLIDNVEFIESYKDRALGCFYSVRRISLEAGHPLNIRAADKMPERNGGRQKVNVDEGKDWWNRITVTSEEDAFGGVRGLCFSFTTGAAREEVRTIYTGSGAIEGLIDSISTDNQWSNQKARAIFELLIPNDFKSRLGKHGNITWVLDKNTARYPWELLQAKGAEVKPLCINAGMIRQLATGDSRINIEPVMENTALIVGDPKLGKMKLPPLPGARAEALKVRDLLNSGGYNVNPHIGESQDTILPALMSPGYKIIHFAGHGLFSSDPKTPSGMVIGENCYLTTADIEQISDTPELVFVNCCYLGKVDGVSEDLFRHRYKLAANLGTQLIEIGVKAVVATGWAVNDAAALLFAETFYGHMLAGATFGNAVREAREAVFEKDRRINTWGAYQCYGNPNYRLVNARWTAAPGSYVIAEQAEIDLTNLLSELQMGENPTRTTAERLKNICAEVDKCSLRTTRITELEATVYHEIGDYDKAIACYKAMITSNHADYSCISIEKYYILRGKQLIKKAQGQAPQRQLEDDFKDLIADLDALIRISPSPERYSILGSVRKREIALYAGNKPKTDKALTACFKAYYQAFSLAPKGSKESIYAYINYICVRSLLVAANLQEWEKGAKAATSVKEILQQLRAMVAARKDLPPSNDLWENITVPNLLLCMWMVDPVLQKGNRHMRSSAPVLESYREVWDHGGTMDQKVTELQHLDLLRKALTTLSPRNFMLAPMEDLEKQLRLILHDKAGAE